MWWRGEETVVVAAHSTRFVTSRFRSRGAARFSSPGRKAGVDRPATLSPGGAASRSIRLAIMPPLRGSSTSARLTPALRPGLLKATAPRLKNERAAATSWSCPRIRVLTRRVLDHDMTGLPTQFGLSDTPPRCPLCRYDLTGIDVVVCPECGGPCSPRDRNVAEQRKKLRAALWISTLAVTPLVIVEGVIAGRYLRTIADPYEPANQSLLPILVCLGIPTITVLILIWRAERAARDPETTAGRLDHHRANLDLATFICVFVGLILLLLPSLGEVRY